MKKHVTPFLLVALGTTLVAAAGCSSDPATTSGTGGTPGGGGAGGGGGASTLTGVLLMPSATGFVDAASNSLGAVGAWYAYGDGYEGGAPPGKCQGSGHMTSECSAITAPALPPGTAGFPPDAMNRMCTAGTAAKVLAIPGMTALDYSNMYGSGIGLDLNNLGANKATFDATAKGVKGISFDIKFNKLSALRVEFATTDTDGSTAGADYWGAMPTGAYPNSPVKDGPNSLTWADVNTPGAAVAGAPPHVFKPNLIESIQFHVPTNMGAAVPYDFCISNLKLLM